MRLVLMAMSAIVVSPVLSAESLRAYDVPLDVLYDNAFANAHAIPSETILARVAVVNEYLGDSGIRLVFQSATLQNRTTTSLCEGPSSMFESLSPTQGRVVLGVSGARANEQILGCAIQDGFAHGLAKAVVQDPPYDGGPLGATPETRDLHANLLYAHEIGHVLGGLHGLAWPQGNVGGATGTIMYPTLQFNIPRYSGIAKDGQCVVHANICRMPLIVALGQGTASASVQSVPPSITLDPPTTEIS